MLAQMLPGALYRIRTVSHSKIVYLARAPYRLPGAPLSAPDTECVDHTNPQQPLAHAVFVQTLTSNMAPCV
jgi:hypothetical protein